jgi:hypothetical protein
MAGTRRPDDRVAVACTGERTVLHRQCQPTWLCDSNRTKTVVKQIGEPWTGGAVVVDYTLNKWSKRWGLRPLEETSGPPLRRLWQVIQRGASQDLS